ncbi:MAG: autotransporter outer membrane beta-barrel domain-containing protein [Candidatus Adiutrix sp.]|jgi:outer membrane autotransporter protein|nr:autotransporter outer membrane beta-barrel domain-containing protein [Candidatus Adiutrix sp.]
MALRFPVFFSVLLASFFWGAAAQAQSSPVNEMRALAHSRLPSQMLLNQGLGLIYGPARQALESQGAEGLRAFGGMSGGRQELSRAGRTEIDGFSFLAGLGRRVDIDDSPLAAFTYGFFGEGGTGNFETGRAFSDDDFRGEGRARYVGGGFLVQTEFHNRFYMEGAFRVGQVRTSLETLYSNNGPVVDPPDSSGTYFSAAGGAGWKMAACDSVELEFYSRLMWSHQGNGEKRVIEINSIDELVEVADVNSTRFTLGTRADFQAGEGRILYAGAAWEHEFNGRAELKINDRPLSGSFAELGGDSLVGEVGLKLSGEDGFSASFGLEGAWGRRQALGGVLRLGYEF